VYNDRRIHEKDEATRQLAINPHIWNESLEPGGEHRALLGMFIPAVERNNARLSAIIANGNPISENEVVWTDVEEGAKKLLMDTCTFMIQMPTFVESQEILNFQENLQVENNENGQEPIEGVEIEHTEIAAGNNVVAPATNTVTGHGTGNSSNHGMEVDTAIIHGVANSEKIRTLGIPDGTEKIRPDTDTAGPHQHPSSHSDDSSARDCLRFLVPYSTRIHHPSHAQQHENLQEHENEMKAYASFGHNVLSRPSTGGPLSAHLGLDNVHPDRPNMRPSTSTLGLQSASVVDQAVSDAIDNAFNMTPDEIDEDIITPVFAAPDRHRRSKRRRNTS
jgi:hypothetical protein